MMKNENVEQKKFKWEFHIRVTTSSGYYVYNTIIKEVSEKEYQLLEEGKRLHLELKYNAALVDIYEDVSYDAMCQEERRCENREEYLDIDPDDFWVECEVELMY